ncbi:D-alanine--D-alanyl carrier protein ligase [Seminavis robusta]|uniref:D-alanine--D-alanyl carrier protein ligase n=1 Tax=Seminavis robusta TaxID=568900 RepID=A0A9N8DPE6_9STRA|nr:D-alanine--D-alanyl carrier protein ligase [Seminavis robusta]|eukprot:Sro193_g082560.1 D-alanine--D-alanyl carrier protein ligase (1752) ;mRNA; r:17006-22440
MKFSTILEALNHHAVETPDQVVFTWVDIKCVEENKMTFKQLEDQSNAVSDRLLKLGCQKGDRVMVAYLFGLEFLAAMFGAMKIGVIPCSIYPPNPTQLKTDMPKFRGFAKDAGAKYALSTNVFAAGMTAASVLYKTGVKWIGTDKMSIKRINPKKPKNFEQFVGEPEAICFIQYTSGSTGDPKGVMITHNNLVETCRAGISLTDLNNASVAALWVPQYHDMGLTGFMSCLYTGSQLIVASPLDFIAKPLLWTDMVEKYKATHTSAPNFAYALLLKRLEQANRKSHWSCMKAAMFGGEPAQSHVVEAVARTLSIKPEQVYNIYGMAEMVVFVTGGPAKTDSEEGLVSCGIVDSPSLKIRIVDDGKEVEDGLVGSIWAQSPRVAAGYYGRSELSNSMFANALPSYDGSWLDTGDLGKIVDGQLYVTGRVKDVIIVNGKNYYPTDVELSIDETFGDIIRPGRTTAFQHGEDSVGITVEGRKDFDKTANEFLAVQIANHVSQVHGLFVSEVVVLKLGVTPKTTSGKLKRSEIRQTTIDGNWKESSIFLHFKPLGLVDNVPELELPGIDLNQTNALPSQAVEAVNAVECDPSKLDEYFLELHLSGVSGMDEAWSKATKTTAAMQEMCSQILQHLEDKHPTICQLAHSLVVNPDWVLIDDRTGFLLQLVHQTFVLQWVTTFMMDHPECMQQKLQNDAEWENLCKTPNTVPVELQEMLNLPEQDPMYGRWPFFLWIKNRSVRAILKLVIKSLSSPEEQPLETRIGTINKLVCLNLLEAVWLEQHLGHKENSQVGRILAASPIQAAWAQSNMAFLENQSSTWNDLYVAWNMHVVAWIGDDYSSTWTVSKLLLPCIVGDVGSNFLYARMTSLYLVLHAASRKIESPRFYNKPILSRRALHQFGKLNLSLAECFGHRAPSQNSNDEMVINEENWLSKFDQWGFTSNPTQTTTSQDYKLHNSTKQSGSANQNHFSTWYGEAVGPDKVSATITSFFGSHVDTSKTWAENGLTSLKSAELRNKVEEVLHVVLPANFEQLYPTPSELSVFLKASESKSFPKQDPCSHSEFLWNSEISKLSKLKLGVLQTLGVIVILILLLSSFVPSIFLVSWVLVKCGSSQVGGCNGLISWVFLPITFPLFLLSLSVILVLCKYAVVGTYEHRQIEILSWGYLRWWFIDRLMEVWESTVGKFFKQTKYIWLFYRLLGADVAWSAKIESYIRECDLVSVGGNATIGHMIKCRSFSQSAHSCPKLTFRPIIIGMDCTISGMVSPGAKIGDGSKVEKLSVVEEGAMVPHDVLAKGNPACHAGSFEHTKTEYWEESMLDACKIVWPILEAYHFFALSYLIHMVLHRLLPSWRYATILHWFLLVPGTSFLAILTSIPLKWLLIGKRDASDEYGGSLWRQTTNWACDFHFQAASWTLVPFFGQSRLWNIILVLHGLDVDMQSTISHPYTIFYPSKVDFVKIRCSFIPTSTLDLSKRADSKIEIINSSIGYNSNLHSGVKIINSKIPPRSNVSGSIYNLNHSDNNSEKLSYSTLLLPEIGQQVLNMVLFCSIVPAYEIGLAATKSSSLTASACGLAVAFTLQLFIWILLTQAAEKVLLSLPQNGQQIFFGIYINHVRQFRAGNWLVMVLYGTPMFAYFARFMGAEVDGDLWYFGNALFEYGKLHFQGCTIVDSSSLNGHYIDGSGLTINDTYVSGVMHPGCFAVAGSVLSGKEQHGPWKVFLSHAGDGPGDKDLLDVGSESTEESTDYLEPCNSEGELYPLI